MPQSLVLLKKLPYPDYLHDLQAKGVYRASMSFLPGGCYAGAALFDASRAYGAEPFSTESGEAAVVRSAPIPVGCPYPEDTLACAMWEINDGLHRLSYREALRFNAFVLIELAHGSVGKWIEMTHELSPPLDDSGYSPGPAGLEYVASGALVGCGSYNVVLEVLADDHQRMLELVQRATDLDTVKQYSLGRLAARDARGFGEPERPLEAATP